MMGRMVTIGLLAALAFGASAQSTDAGFKTVRGDNAIPSLSEAPKSRQWQDPKPIPRQYIQQPPVISHSIEGQIINKEINQCLFCHSWSDYQASGATKISLTHFTDREGHDLANVASRRYFCVQCHVPQSDAPPLVGSDFKSLWAPLVEDDED